MTSKPDILVIGGETAGFEFAFAAAGLGARVVLVEQDVPLAPDRKQRLLALGASVLAGAGAFQDKRRFRHGDQVIQPRYAVIANGSRRQSPMPPAGQGRKVVILGGGPAAVTAAREAARDQQPVLIACPDHFLPGFEAEHAEWLRLTLAKQGISVLEQCGLPDPVPGEDDGLVFGGGRRFAATDYGQVLALTDRRPGLDSLDAMKAGIASGDVDRFLRTANPRVFLVGDGIADRPDAPPQRQQVALVIAQALYGRRERADARFDTRHVHGRPGISSLGLLSSKLPTGERSRHQVLRATLPGTGCIPKAGLLVVVDRKSRIVGASAYGERAPELLATLVLVAQQAEPVTRLAALPVSSEGEESLLGQIARQPLLDKLRTPAARRLLRWRRFFG